mmetsp:Transcript_34949/g.56397  ORF Transcript_34949/g.56397 Transcript_34949/m.56397 type:complete len:114 (+) Transcript_34949:2556-2897(+)
MLQGLFGGERSRYMTKLGISDQTESPPLLSKLQQCNYYLLRNQSTRIKMGKVPISAAMFRGREVSREITKPTVPDHCVLRVITNLWRFPSDHRITVGQMGQLRNHLPSRALER